MSRNDDVCNNYCPSQDWDRYCNDNYYPEPEMTRFEKFLNFIGIDVDFRLKPTQSVGTQYLNLWLGWGLVQFSLYFFRWKFSSFNFYHYSPFYGVNGYLPFIIGISAKRIIDFKTGKRFDRWTFAALKEYSPELDEFGCSKTTTISKTIDTRLF